MKITPSAPVRFMENSVSADRLKERKLRKACADFEAIMLKQMLAEARKSVPAGGIFTKGYAEEMYQTMRDGELAEKLATGKGMGFGEMLYRQLSEHLHPTRTK